MNVEKQREIIRLGIACARSKVRSRRKSVSRSWSCSRCRDLPSARINERRAVLDRVPVRTAQIHRIGERGNNATL